jgi:hypothetical protein
LSPISKPSPCPSSPGAREPTSVAISIDPLRKKGAMMPKANVSQGKTKMDKLVRRRELPYVRHSKKLYRKRVVCGVMLMSKERKKSEEAKKRNDGIRSKDAKGG